MKLYAICWQDVTEPWGWEPAATGDPGDPPQAFFWDREEADEALAAHMERVASDATEWSVKEYDLPPLGKRVMVFDGRWREVDQ